MPPNETLSKSKNIEAVAQRLEVPAANVHKLDKLKNVRKRRLLRSKANSRSFSNLMKALSVPDLKKLGKTKDNIQMYYRDLMKRTEDATFDLNSSDCCPHRFHCIHNALYKGLFRSFAFGYVFKTTINLTRALFGKGRLTLDSVVKIYLAQESIRFAQWLALQSFTFKLILCALRRFFKQTHPIMNGLAGFISGFWIMVDIPERRSQLALYCAVRAFTDFLHSLDLPKVGGTDILAFALTQIPIMHCYVSRPGLLDRKYAKWIHQMGAIPVSRKKLHEVTATHVGPLKSCANVFHHGDQCVRANVLDFLFLGLVRAARMYIPVHFLPTLLFEPIKVVRAPLRFLKRKSANTLRSSLFLSSYQAVMKLCICLGRKLLQSNSWFISCFAGFVCGLSIKIEHPRRRIELLLYTLPRALEGIARGIPRTTALGRFIRWRWMSLILYQLAIGLWMYTIGQIGWSKKLNSLNTTVLKIVFGSKH